jgi:hypothetical protein
MAHRQSIPLVISGLLLQAYGVLLVVSGACELHMIRHIDYAGPVLEIQRRLAQLRVWRSRLVGVWVVTGCFVWIPLVLVAFKAWFGADIYANAPEVVVAFFGSGVGCLVLLRAVQRWMPGAARHMDHSSVGKRVLHAQGVLDEIARFQRD